MPKVIGSASGNNLKITIPERGEKNWDELIENSCFTPISNHSHTGNGDGAKIDTDALEDNAVTTDKIADNSITSAKIAADVIADIDLAPDSVGTSELKNDAVETANILDANVTTSKIADSNITTSKIADANVTEAKLANGSVTSSKIGANAVVGSTQIVDGTISGNKLQGDPMMGGAVNLSNLADVVGTSPTAGQLLQWTQTDWDGMGGYQWVPSTISTGGSTTITSQTDINNYTPSFGDILHVTVPTAVNANLDFTAKTLVGVTIFIEDQVQANPNDYGVINFEDLTSCSINMNSTGTSLYLEGNIKNSNINADYIYVTTGSGTTHWKDSSIKCNEFTLEYLGTGGVECNGVDISTRGLREGTTYSVQHGSDFFKLDQHCNFDIGFMLNTFSNGKYIQLKNTGAIFGGNPAENSSRIILKREITGRNLRVEDSAGYMGYNNAGAVELIGENYQRNI